MGVGRQNEPERGSDPGARLMLAWRGGDERAFEQLVSDYSGRVFALLTRFLGHSSAREDLVQEVFLRVVGARDRYEPTARFTTWLYRIVFNLAVNETQRNAHREAASIDPPADAAREGAGTHELPDGDAPDPSDALQRADVVHAVRSAIAALPTTQRMALVLARYHDLPYVEIATVLGSTEKAIKSLIHRARTSLRESLAPFLAEEMS